jgi:hypothetical protein
VATENLTTRSGPPAPLGRSRTLLTWILAAVAAFWFLFAFGMAWQMAMQGPKSSEPREVARDLALVLALIAKGCLWSLVCVLCAVFDTRARLQQLAGQMTPQKEDKRGQSN